MMHCGKVAKNPILTHFLLDALWKSSQKSNFNPFDAL